MNPQDRIIRVRPDHEPRCDDGAIIPALAVDMFDIRNRLDDLFQRFRHLLDCIGGPQTG